jgi:hydrogenase maturation protease
MRDTRGEGEDRARTVIIGYGNPERGDDGAGLLAAESLREQAPGHIEVWTSAGDATSLLDAWAGREKAVLIDVFESGGVPGTVYRFEGQEALDMSAKAHTSTHGLGLREAIHLGKLLDQMPKRLVVIGVEAGAMGFGGELTPEVREAMPEIRRRVLEEL